MKYWLGALIAILMTGIAVGQETPPARDAPSEAEQRVELLNQIDLQEGQEAQEEQGNPAMPVPPDPAVASGELTAAYAESLRAYYDYRITGYQHRQRVFVWQLLSSKIIFGIVVALVAVGVYFAAVQFHTGLARTSPDSEADTTTEFVFSFKELKVRSPVLGVVVLTISLAFFYLYLVYVYPIGNVF